MATSKQKYPTIRIKAETHKLVKQLAEEDDMPMSDVVEQAMERYRRDRIVRKANEVWVSAMGDPELKRIWAEENAAIDATFWSQIPEPYEEGEDEER